MVFYSFDISYCHDIVISFIPQNSSEPGISLFAEMHIQPTQNSYGNAVHLWSLICTAWHVRFVNSTELTESSSVLYIDQSDPSFEQGPLHITGRV